MISSVAPQILLLLGSSLVSARSILSGSKNVARHESVQTLPAGWSLCGTPSPDEPLRLRVTLTRSHKDLIPVANDVSDPASSRYGKHLTAEEVERLLPDTGVSSKAVQRWLRQNSVDDFFQGRDWLTFNTTVEAAGRLLDADFASYCHDDGTAAIRTQAYSLPRHLTEHIDFVSPTVDFSRPSRLPPSKVQRRQHVPTGPATCKDNTCPALLQKKYNINYRPQDDKSGSKLGVAGFLENFPSADDVKQFLLRYGVHNDTVPPHWAVTSINKGRTAPPKGGGSLTVEPDLDLDYSMAFTGPLPVTFYSVGGRPPAMTQPGNKTASPAQNNNEPYLEFFQHLLAEKSPPLVVSISYSDDEQTVPERYARRVCDLFAQAAARGISIIGSSGDGGAAGTGGSNACLGPDGKKRFIPTFPSSCPWMTSVGATAAYGGVASFSSGGFSNYFPAPAWQTAATQGYVRALGDSHKGFYNASGRGIPDVSLLGDDFLILSGGYAHTQDGTSASAPVFAAMVALVNDIRLRTGKPVLGFLNPLIYARKLKEVFRDVADGSQSEGCADGSSFEPGWEALKGWDAGTGLGEPDFAKLRAALV